MREKMLDKVIIGLAVFIGLMIVLFIIGMVQIKMEEKHVLKAEASASQVEEKETTTASKKEEDNTVVDEKSQQTTKEASKSTQKVEFDENEDYILPESDERLYTKFELSNLTKNQLAIARNEIYAKHGYIFSKNKNMREYFEGKSWYVGTTPAKDFDESVFNQYEKKNIDLIVELEGK